MDGVAPGLETAMEEAFAAILSACLLYTSLNRTLLGDGLATTMAGLLGGPANTTYGENTGVLALSKICLLYTSGSWCRCPQS